MSVSELSKIPILPPLDGKNSSISIPKIRFESKLLESDSDDEVGFMNLCNV